MLVFFRSVQKLRNAKRGGRLVCYDMIKMESKLAFLALWMGGGGVEFGLKLCYVIYDLLKCGSPEGIPFFGYLKQHISVSIPSFLGGYEWGYSYTGTKPYPRGFNANVQIHIFVKLTTISYIWWIRLKRLLSKIDVSYGHPRDPV